MADWNDNLRQAAQRAADLAKAYIRKDGPSDKPYCVYGDSGRSMGCYPSRKQAEERLAQVEMFKHMKEA